MKSVASIGADGTAATSGRNTASPSTRTSPSRASEATASASPRLRAGDDRAESRRPPLAERALERALAAGRLEAAAARRARGRERAGAAARDPREADRLAEIHQRLRRRRARTRGPSAPTRGRMLTSTGRRGPLEGEAGDGVGGVAPDAGQVGKVFRPAMLGDDLPGGTVEVDGATVVAEAGPGADYLGAVPSAARAAWVGPA